jgi:predicted transcriptional regulator
MYKANLAHRQLKEYLKELMEKDLVSKESTKDGDFYLITENGIKYLKKIYEMKEFEKTFGF